MPDRAWPVLFARNLFLPEDLGGNRYPYETVRRLGARGHPVTVVTARLHGHFPALPGVRYRSYPVSRRHSLATHLTNVVAGAVSLLPERAHRKGVALAGSYDSALALNLAGVCPRLPLVFLFHSEFYSEWVQALGGGSRAVARRLILSYMELVERRVFAASARLVAVSKFSAGQVARRVPAAQSRIRQVSTGVDTTYFCPPLSKDEAKRTLGIDTSQPLFLGVGRLVRVKQFDRLVRAFALAKDGGLRARLVIAGGGPERGALERLCRELEVEDAVHLVGYCDPAQLRAWMQAADLQVCTSAFENFSLAILEGLACGTPVLGTPGGGIPEQVGAVSGGLVLPDDAPETIASALMAWASRPEERQALGRQARRLTVELYDWERVVDRLEAVCAEVARA